MSKKIILPLLIISLIVIMAACNKPSNSQPEKIKIGVLTPLTGDAGAWGQATKRGIELALDKLKEQNKDFELIYEDSTCNPKTGTTATNKLINQDRVDAIIGTVCSSVTLAIAPTVNNNQIPLLSVGATSPEITLAGGDYIFRNWPSDTYEGSVISSFARHGLNLDSVSILYLNNDYGLGLKKVFTEIFERNGGKIIGNESFELKAKDFKSQLNKIASNNSDGIFIATNPEEAPIILKQIEELKLNQKILINGVVESSNLLDSAQNSAEGIFYAAYGWRNPDWFLESYKNKYNKDYEIPADTAYDSLMLISKAIDGCGKVDSTCIKDELYKIKDYMGAAGKTTFDENGDVVDKEFVIKTVRNGKFVEYEKRD